MSAIWYFDIISPFAYLQLQRLPEIRYFTALTPVPIALGAVLAHCGQLGPAEIPSKRNFAYRFIDFQARAMGHPIRFPPTHPFNPLPALRLLCAVPESQQWEAIELVFQHIWRDGLASDSAQALEPVAARLGMDDVSSKIEAAEAKARLKQNTEEAISRGVFGVPSLEINGELFWGADATDYALAYLKDPTLLSTDEAKRLLHLPASVQRKR